MSCRCKAVAALRVLVLLAAASIIPGASAQLLGNTSSNIGLVIFRLNATTARLEANRNGSWGTVCNARFSSVAARLLCALFDREPYTWASMGNSWTAPIVVGSVSCPTWASLIEDCSLSTFVGSCQHTQDVALYCALPKATTTTRPPNRYPASMWELGRGSDNRLLVRGRANQSPAALTAWGSVCAASSLVGDSATAQFLCRSVGLGDSIATAERVPAGTSPPPYISLYWCSLTSDSTNLALCQYSEVINASVACAAGVALTCTVDMRLGALNSGAIAAVVLVGLIVLFAVGYAVGGIARQSHMIIDDSDVASVPPPPAAGALEMQPVPPFVAVAGIPIQDGYAGQIASYTAATLQYSHALAWHRQVAQWHRERGLPEPPPPPPPPGTMIDLQPPQASPRQRSVEYLAPPPPRPSCTATLLEGVVDRAPAPAAAAAAAAADAPEEPSDAAALPPRSPAPPPREAAAETRLSAAPEAAVTFVPEPLTVAPIVTPAVLGAALDVTVPLERAAQLDAASASVEAVSGPDAPAPDIDAAAGPADAPAAVSDDDTPPPPPSAAPRRAE